MSDTNAVGAIFLFSFLFILWGSQYRRTGTLAITDNTWSSCYCAMIVERALDRVAVTFG
ncbi:hypothetical protein L873DRAFT_1821620 [Choiromyces venosus 120613-1]|uniref:Uncharacterized protein n=1 Tax=Choiromyces venosus 120613-1 TaxID=1336337 RepID=A0A3N4IZG7_9PEZI|nr:hypothetical protein L873DRAFT_1821620 [Choiromyces venosus 120613-1]